MSLFYSFEPLQITPSRPTPRDPGGGTEIDRGGRYFQDRDEEKSSMNQLQAWASTGRDDLPLSPRPALCLENPVCPAVVWLTETRLRRTQQKGHYLYWSVTCALHWGPILNPAFTCLLTCDGAHPHSAEFLDLPSFLPLLFRVVIQHAQSTFTSDFIHPARWFSMKQHHPQFTDKETERQEGQLTCLRSPRQ